MRIQNILEIINTDITQQKYSKSFQEPSHPMPHTGLDISDPRYEKGLRAGTFSQVSPSKDDPHTIKKRSKFPKDPRRKPYMSDPFGEFVEFLNKENAFSNTYIPKVYNFKTIVDSEGKEIYKYNIEKLNEIQNLSSEQIEFLKRKIFKKIPENKELDSGKDLAEFINRIIGDYINNDRKSYTDVYINDDELIEAADIIKKFVRFRNIHKGERQTLYDRSWTNIMYRNTPYGPQLVFADPVFDKKAF